jgi:hypothetical protein
MAIDTGILPESLEGDFFDNPDLSFQSGPTASDVINSLPTLMEGVSISRPSVDPIQKSLEAFANAPTSLQTQAAPRFFDYEATRADRYVQSKNFRSLGFNPTLGQENEYKYGYRQTWDDVWSNGLAGMAGLASDAFVEGWKGWGRMTEALFSLDASKLMGSPLEREQMAKAQEDLLNKYAIYSTPEGEKGILNREFFGNMLQQSGFMVGTAAQMLVEYGLTAGFGSLIGTAGKAGALLKVGQTTAELIDDTRKVASAMTRSERVVQAIADLPRVMIPLYGTLQDVNKIRGAGAGLTQMGILGLGGIRRELSMFNMARSEAIFESASTYADLKKRLTDEYILETGQAPTAEVQERIDQKAEDATHDNFWTNMGVLSVMNRIQFDNIIKSFNPARKLFTDDVSKVAEQTISVTGKIGDKTVTQGFVKGALGSVSALPSIAKTFGKKTAAWEATKMLGRNLMKFEASEGVQELIQEAASKGLGEYYYDLYHGNKGYNSKTDAVLSSIENPLTSNEGMKTFLMGALTGRLIAPVSSAITGVANYKENQKLRKQAKEDLAIVNSFLKDPTNSIYAKEWIANTKVQGKAAQTMAEAVSKNSEYMFHNAKNSAFAKAVASAIKLDMYDSMRSTLLELGEDLSDKEFLEAFNFNPTVENKKSVKEYMGELVTKMEDYYNTYTSLRKRYADKIIPELYKNNSPEEYAQALLAKQTLDDAIEVLTTNTVLGRQAVVRASGLQQKMGASKTIGASTNEIVTRLGSEELMNDEVKKLKEEIAMMTAPQVELSAEQKELLEQKKQELSLVERFQGMYNDVMNEDDQSSYPSAETNAYKAFADLVAFYNKRAKINTTIETQDVDDAFIYLVDYMRLNRDSASYVNAMNMLANPRDLKILVNAMRTGKEFLNKKLAEEKVKELEKIAGEEGKENARRVTVQLKDKAGNPVSQEIVEGEEYLTEASPEVRVYPKQKTKTTTYKQDIIKIVEIGANQITFTINNSGESVTYTLDEFQEHVGKLFPLSSLTPDQRIFFRNRNKRFKLNVRGKTGKRHLIYGKHKDADYTSNGVEVEAQLELEQVEVFGNDAEPEMIYDEESDTYYYDNTPKERKFEYVLMVSYINPVTKLKEKFRYDHEYLKKYGSNKFDIVDVTISEEEYMRSEENRRRSAQIEILNNALNETLNKADEQLNMRKELETAQQKLQTELEDLIAEMELLEEFLANNKSKRSKKITQLKKENKERLLIVGQLINTTKDTIEKNRELLAAVEQQLDVLERAIDYYERGILMLNTSNKPFTMSQDGTIYQDEVQQVQALDSEYTMNPQRRDPSSSKFIEDATLGKAIEDTEAEINLITENINELEGLLERLNTLLGKILAFEDIYNMLSTVTDREQLRNQLKLMEDQIVGDTEETDNYKLLAKKQLLSALRKGLAKGDLGIEFQYTLELIDQVKEAKERLAGYQEELNKLQPKLDRLQTERDTRAKAAAIADRITVLKFIQNELVRQFKLRQEKAGIKVEGNKVIVAPSIAGTAIDPTEDDLIKGADSILVTQVVEDLIPEGEEERQTFSMVDGAVPVLNDSALFKSAGRHFEDLNDTILNSAEDARFFKFSETVKLRESQADGGGVIYYFMPVTQDSKMFQELRVIELTDGTKFEDDIRFVVVRKDASGNFKPVDVNGNILTAPTKDNMVYTAMLGHPDLLSGNKEKMVAWVTTNFINKENRYSEEEIVQIANNFISIREEVKKRVKNGENVVLPIQDKSPGVFNREPKTATEDGRTAPQELSLEGRLIEANPDFKNLKHPDGSAVRLTVSTFGSRVRPGRLLMVKNDDPTSAILVYNRKLTEKEHENIISVLKRMSELFGLKSVGALDEESDQEFQNGVRYLQGVIHWFRPKEGKDPYPFQMWVDNGLHVGGRVMEFSPESIDANKSIIIEALTYHKVNNTLLTSPKYQGQSFPEVSVVDNKIVVGKKYFNYQEYLLTEREGGPVVYTNIKPYVAPSNDLQPQDFQLKNVYLRYSVDHLMELPPVAKAPTVAEKEQIAEQAQEGEIKKYSINLTSEIGPDKQKYYSLTHDIPTSGMVTFVGLRNDGKTKLYIHAEAKDGKFTVTKIVDENGVDNANGTSFVDLIGDAWTSTINNNLFENFLNMDNLKLFPGDGSLETKVQEIIKTFSNKILSIEEYTGKGENITEKTEDAKRPPVSVEAPQAVDEEYLNFVDEKYEAYVSDPANTGEDMLSFEQFESVFSANLRDQFKKLKSAKPKVTADAVASNVVIETKAGKEGTKSIDAAKSELNKLKELISKTSDLTSIVDVVFKVLDGNKYEAWQEKLDQSQILNDLKDQLQKAKSDSEIANIISKYLVPKFIDEQLAALEGAKPAASTSTPISSSAVDKILNDALDDEDAPFDPNARVETADEANKVRENVEEFKKWMGVNLSQIPIEILDELIDSRYAGQFYKGVIRLFKNAEVGTGFHEAFEAVWNAMLTEDKKAALINEYKNRPDYVNDKYYVWARENYKHLSENGIIKEALAEEFREYMLTNAANVKPNSPKRNTFFRKIWNFILKLLGLSTDTQEKFESKIDELFSDISTGKFNKAPIVSSYDPFIKQNKAIPGLSVEFTELLMEGMSAMFFMKLHSDNRNINDLFNPKNTLFETIYSEILSALSKEFRPGYKAMVSGENYKNADEQTKEAATNAYDERQRQLQGAELYDQKLKSILMYNGEVKENFKKYLSQFGLSFQQVEVDQDDVIEQMVEKEESSNTLGIKDVIYVDPTNMTNPTVRLLILSLPNDIQDIDGKIESIEKNALGLYSLVPYKKKMNTLLNELSNVVPVYRKQKDGSFKYVSALELMYEKLNTKFKDPNHPNRYKPGYTWISRLFKRLKYDALVKGEALSDDELRLILAFENSFNRNRNIPIKIMVGIDGRIREVNAISVTTKQKIKEEWRNSVTDKQLKSEISSADPGKQDILVINTGGFIEINLKSDELKRAMASSTSIQEKMRTLSKLGIKLSKPSAYFSNEEINIVNSSFLALKGVMEDYEKRNERFFYSQLFDRRTVTGPLNRLLEIESEYRSEDMMLSHLTPENKTQYAITLPSEISNILSVLNAVNSLDEFIMTNPQYGVINKDGSVTLHPYTSTSEILKPGGIVFDKDGNKYKNAKGANAKSVDYVYIQGMASDQNNEGNNTDRLVFNDKLVQEMYHILMHGTYYSVINSDKSSEFGIKMGHFVSPQDILNNNLIEEKYLNALRAEVLHALQFHFFPNNIKNHQKNILQLGHFKGVLNFSDDPAKQSALQKVFLNLVNGIKVTKKTSPATVDQLFNLAADNFISEVKNQGVIKKYIDTQTIQHQDWLMSKKIIQYNEETKRYTTLSIPDDNPLLGEEVKNMSAIDLTKLIRFLVVNRQLAVYEQHKLFYGHPALYKDLPKRTNGANSQKNPASENPAVINKMNETKPRFDGAVRNPNRLVTRVQTYEDPLVVSRQLTYIAEELYKGFMKIIDDHKKVSEMIGAEFDKKTQTFKKLNLTKTSLLNAYHNMTESDGQAYIMPDYFRDLMYLSSLLSPEQEELLRYENALEVVERSEADPSSEIYKRYDDRTIEEAREILKNKKPEAILQPLKPQGFGFSLTDKMSHLNMLKDSVFPLTWSRVRTNPNMLAKYIDAQNSQTDIISFTSGHKVGVVTDDKGNVPALYDSEGNITKESPKPLEILSRFIGIQVQTDDYSKDKVIFGSQIRKIILGNLPESLKEKRDYYIGIINELIEIEKNTLLEEMGLKFEDGIYKTVNLEKLVNTLKDQAIRRNLPDNVIDMLDVVTFDTMQQLRHPLDANPSRERIEFVLTALVDNRLVRSEMFGKAAVQVASTMFENGKRDMVYLKDGVYQPVTDVDTLTPAQKKSMRISSSELNFYSGESPYMEVYLPWYFKGISPENAGFVKSPQGYWVPKDPAQMEKLFKAIGFRIPSQAFNSVDSIRIKGFVDSSYGDVVVVPSEMVGKNGSDFDIDKLNMFLKNYTLYEGKLSVIEFSTSEEELESRYIDKVREREGKDVRELMLTLSLEERNQIREDFATEKARIEKELDQKYKAQKASLQEMQDEKMSETYQSAVDAEGYFKELFDIGKKLYRNLDPTVKEFYQRIKAYIAQNGIQGPREIELYLENTIRLRESNLYEDQNALFDNMIKIYQEELKVLGHRQYLDEYVKNLQGVFRSKKDELNRVKREARNIEISDISYTKNENLRAVYLDMAKQAAKLIGYYSFEEFSKLPLIQQNSKKALQNELIEVMSEIIEHPENRRQLLVPNSTQTLKTLAEYIEGLRGYKSYVENDMTKLSEWKTMAETRETFVTSKQLVGSGAQHVTSHAMAQIGEVELTGSYVNRDGQTKVVNLKLTNSNTNKLDLVLDAESMFIFDLLSEALSGSVDAAKDPFIYELRLNLETASTWFYLTRRGVPQKEVALFFNQPILDRYFDVKASNNTYVNKTNDVKMTYNEVLLETMKPFYEKAFGKPLIINEDSSIREQVKRIQEAVQKLYSKYSVTDLEKAISAGKNLSKEDALRQLGILFDALDYMEQGGMLFNFIQSIGYDTTRTKTIMEYRMQQYRYRKPFMDKFVTEESMSRVFDRTFLSKIKSEKERMLSIFGEFFVSLHVNVLPAFDPIIQQIENPKIFMSETDKIELLKRYQSYVITYILQNTPYGREQAIKESFGLFMDQPGKPSFPKTLKKLREKYPENKALISLFPIINDNRFSTDNIKLFNNSLTSYDINLLSTSIENLVELSRKENDEDLTEFVNNLTKFTILQSGLQNSPITFTKVMPISLYSDVVSRILRTFTSQAEGLDVQEVWKTFHQNYYKNSLIVPTAKAKGSNFENGLFIQKGTSKTSGYDYVKVYNLRKGVTKEMIKQGHLKSEEMFEIKLYEKIKIYKNGIDITDTLPSIRYRPINILGNGMYLLEASPADITGRSRLSTNQPFDETSFDEAVQNFSSMIINYGDSSTPNFDKLPEYDYQVSRKTYAGIGSRGDKRADGTREIPQNIRERFVKAIGILNKLEFTARTGDAAGSDGIVRTYAANGKTEVFTKDDATPVTREIAREIHPKPEALSNDALDLMARNTNQVFGQDLDSPVDFVLVYEPSGYDGSGQRPERGGSNQAIDMAYRKGIPVINIALDNWESLFNQVLADLATRTVIKPTPKRAASKPAAAPKKTTTAVAAQPTTTTPAVATAQPAATTASFEQIVQGAIVDILKKLGVNVPTGQKSAGTYPQLLGNVSMALIEPWVKQGTATTTVRNMDYHKRFYKGDGIYRTDNGTVVEITHKGTVKLQGNRIFGPQVNLSKEEFAAKEGFGTWLKFIEGAKWAGKSLIAGKEVEFYEVKYIGEGGPMFKDLPEFTATQKQTILNNFASKHKMTREAAETYINDALIKVDRNFVISKLKECY